MNTIIEAPMKKIPPILIRAKYKSVGSPFFTEKNILDLPKNFWLKQHRETKHKQNNKPDTIHRDPLHNFKSISLFALPNFFASIHAL